MVKCSGLKRKEKSILAGVSSIALLTVIIAVIFTVLLFFKFYYRRCKKTFLKKMSSF